MRRWRCILPVAVIAIALMGSALSEAAVFSLTGTSNFSGSDTLTLTQFQWCNYSWVTGTPDITIDPRGGERIGDPVTINYCYSVTGSTTTPGEPWVAIAGIGDSASFEVHCLVDSLPNAGYTAPTNPATLILNPGPGQSTIISYGPQVLTGTQTASQSQCGTINAHIGDTIQGDSGVFALLYDTRGFPAGQPNENVTASISYDFQANIISLKSTPVPTLTHWGMIALAGLLAAGALYLLRRRRLTI